MKKLIAGILFYGWYAICVVLVISALTFLVHAALMAVESPQGGEHLGIGIFVVGVLFVINLPTVLRVWNWAKRTLEK